MNPKFLLLFCALAVASCGGRDSAIESALPEAAKALAQCHIDDPRREIGAGLDASGRLRVDSPPVGSLPAACASNRGYLMGSGLHDITAPIADTASLAWVNPQQNFSGLHTRVYARAFAMESPCNGKRILFVSIDTGLMSADVRQAVLAEIAADEALAPLYSAHNLMLSVTHTHSDPGTGLAGIGNGKAVIVSGIVAAIRMAHANLQANPQTGSIRLSSGELLDTNINRSKPAFAMNPQAERQSFINARGEEVQVNKEMLQLELQRDDGRGVGLINWFGVHPTVLGPEQSLVSGDVKGTAALEFERLMATNYQADPADGTFVAAFAQSDEGDSSPNIHIEAYPYPSAVRGGGENAMDSNAISALKQLARALELYGSGDLLQGPVDYRLIRVPIDNISVQDPVVLDSLQHPVELDSGDKRTCSGVLGVSFGAGAEDGPGPTVEGVSCADGLDVLAAAMADIETIAGTNLEGFPGGWPSQLIPPQLLSTVAMCNVSMLPPVLGDFSCQAEKPVLLPRGPAELPIQLLRVGQLAILGLPWEVTTMSARRLKSALLQELAPVGVETIVVAGLVNDYVHYLTTREEYASQQYEGASNLYGPWTLAAVTQESLKLARAMRHGELLDVDLPVLDRADLSLQPGPLETPHAAGAPGTVITQPPAQAQAGDVLRAEVVAGHPGNDLRLQQSYVYVEQEQDDGSWAVVAQDRDPALVYVWKPLIKMPFAAERPPVATGGSAEVIWQTPQNLPAGRYRFRVEGQSRGLLGAQATPYQAVTQATEVLALAGADCPGSLAPPAM